MVFTVITDDVFTVSTPQMRFLGHVHICQDRGAVVEVHIVSSVYIRRFQGLQFIFPIDILTAALSMEKNNNHDYVVLASHECQCVSPLSCTTITGKLEALRCRILHPTYSIVMSKLGISMAASITQGRMQLGREKSR